MENIEKYDLIDHIEDVNITDENKLRQRVAMMIF